MKMQWLQSEACLWVGMLLGAVGLFFSTVTIGMTIEGEMNLFFGIPAIVISVLVAAVGFYVVDRQQHPSYYMR